MEKVTRKVCKEGHVDDYYILQTEWTDGNNLLLTVIDNDAAWTGKLESADMERLSKTMRKEKEKYCKELRHALSEDEKDFTFFIEENVFIVKKVDHKSDIKIKFCIIELQKVELIPTYFSLAQELLDQEKENRRRILDLTEQVQYLTAEREMLTKTLQLYSSEKASMEAILYSQFCEILNAKKEKIASLQSQCGTERELLQEQNVSQCSSNENTNALLAKRARHNDCPPPKRKFVTVKQSGNEHSTQPEEDDMVLGHASSRSQLNDQKSSHYDSDTDIDTDDECVVRDTVTVQAVKETTLSLDTPEKNSNRRILPRRVQSASSLNSSSKSHDEPNVKPSSSHIKEEAGDEFNSQSLLDDY